MRRGKGFTLIELLVVVAIIGILATLVLTQYGNVTGKARTSAAKSDIGAAGNAVELFKADDQAVGQIISANSSNINGARLQGTTTDTSTNHLNFKQIFAPGQQVVDPALGASHYSAGINKTPSNSITYSYTTSPATILSLQVGAGLLFPSGSHYKVTAWGLDTNVDATTGSVCVVDGSMITSSSNLAPILPNAGTLGQCN